MEAWQRSNSLRSFDNSKNQPYEFMKRTQEAFQEKYRIEAEYNASVLNTLIKIENNTANLTALIELIKDNNERQEEILNVIMDLLSVAKETNKENAQNKYRKIMNKISDFSNDFETFMKLTTFATTVHGVLQSTGIM